MTLAIFALSEGVTHYHDNPGFEQPGPVLHTKDLVNCPCKPTKGHRQLFAPNVYQIGALEAGGHVTYLMVKNSLKSTKVGMILRCFE